MEQDSNNVRASFFDRFNLRLLLVVYLVLIPMLLWNTSRGRDFRAFYTAGVLLRTDHAHLYDFEAQHQLQNTLISWSPYTLPFYHPSYEAILFVPFSLFDYATAYRLFQVLNLGILVVLVFGFKDLFSKTNGSRWVLFFLSTLPVLGCIYQSQDTLLALLIFTASWKQVEKGRNFNAGLLLALSLFKFQVAIPIALLLILRKGKRFAAGFTLGAAGVAVVSFALIGFSGWSDFFKMLHSASLISNDNRDAMLSLGVWPSCMPNLNGLVYSFGGRFLPAQTEFLVVAGVSFVVLLLCAWVVLISEDDRLIFAVAVLAGTLLSDHLSTHDIAIISLPAALAGTIYKRIAAYSWAPVIPLFVLFSRLLFPSTYFVLVWPVILLLACIAYRCATNRDRETSLFRSVSLVWARRSREPVKLLSFPGKSGLIDQV